MLIVQAKSAIPYFIGIHLMDAYVYAIRLNINQVHYRSSNTAHEGDNVATTLTDQHMCFLARSRCLHSASCMLAQPPRQP